MSTTEAQRKTTNGAIEDLDVIVVGRRDFAGLYLPRPPTQHGAWKFRCSRPGTVLAVSGIWKLLSWGPRRFSRPHLPIFGATTCAEMAVRELYPSWQETPRLFFRYVDEKNSTSVGDIRFKQDA